MDQIYPALEAASSQDPALAQQGLSVLQALQNQPGAFTEMLSVAANRSAPLNTRRIAIIQFKNVAITNWRSRILFSDENRNTIRAGLITFLEESDETIADCSAVIIAKIYRMDLGKVWPQLLPNLASVIQSNVRARFGSRDPPPHVSLNLRRALYVLNQLLKELSAYKLPSGIQQMIVIIKDTQPFLTEKYGQFSSHLLSSISPATLNSPQVLADIQVSHLLYKCLAKNVVWLWARPKGSPADDPESVSAFFSGSVPQFRNLFELRIKLLTTIQTSGPDLDVTGRKSVESLTKHVLTFGKVFRRLQQPALPRFVALPRCSDLVLYYWQVVVDANNAPDGYTDGKLASFTIFGGLVTHVPSPTVRILDTHQAIYPSRILLQGMVLFKACLGQWTSAKQANVDRGNPILNQQFVSQAVELVVTRFLPLKAHDLEKWEEDPEEWAIEEVKEYETWEFDIRYDSSFASSGVLPCASTFPLMYLSFMPDGPSPSNLNGILPREAIYFSIGGSYNRLRSSIDIDTIVSTFATDIRNPNPVYRILKHRIAWFLGKSAPEDESLKGAEPTAKIWDILEHLVQDQSPSSDLAVRISAAIAIRERIDCLAFEPESLSPFLASIVSALMRLIAEVDSLESKTQIARTLNTVIESNAERMVPFMSMITDPIPELWQSSGTDHLFKAALLDTMVQLVNAAKAQSVNLLHIVIPIVQESLKPENILQLDEDALNLWLATLRNATSLRPTEPGGATLLILAPTAIQLLADNLDLLGTIVSIMEAYFLLDAPALLQAFGNETCMAIDKCVRQAVSANIKDLLSAVELLVANAPAAAWAQPMYNSGFFKRVLETVLANKGASDVNNSYLHVMARLVLADPLTFLQMLGSLPGEDPSKNLDRLMDSWWRQFDSLSEPRRRKLSSMAIGALVSTGQPEVLKHLAGDIFNLWLDVLGEMKEALEQSEDSNHLTLYWRDAGATLPDSMMKGSEGTLEEVRRRQTYQQDPVNGILLTAFLRERLEQGRQNAPGGPQAFDAFMQQADPLVVKQILDGVSR